MNEFPKMFIILGVVFIVIGIVWSVFGKLPGDILFKKGNTTFYFPIMTSIIVSVVLSVLLYIIGKIR
ncbi:MULTISPECIES: DUF2905 domain-containing protein [Pontibacillus]|uniref:DUF2905 domain-containing protein n=1 Tax=Pontibacillus chungwhensis TaxID=265426 RepID=A0ABY8UUH9_9BACI|nr:DUF2905 domain-containing protein [Pontibacillus chungwhensis]MCD5323703.1 DUF2905 domain-containing protein [Pontibacillus sp. HN14]WIF97068.1 DUF2905 domain-containing protein [Pontibacillus chungwhensis]